MDGWAYGCPNYEFDDLLVLAYIQILNKAKTNDNFVFKIPETWKIIPYLVKVSHSAHGISLNISPKYFKLLMELYHQIKNIIPEGEKKRMLSSLTDGLSVLTIETNLSSLK